MMNIDVPKVKTTPLKNGVVMIDAPVFKKDIPVMALSVVKKIYDKGAPFRGVVREIIKRQGNPSVYGFIDQSKLFLVESDDLVNWRESGELQIKGIDNIINSIKRKDFDFIGLEDPDVFIDERQTFHLFFTIAFKVEGEQLFAVFLGHAEGDRLEALTATDPVLSPEITEDSFGLGYKEVSLIPKEDRINLALAETGFGTLNTSVVAVKVIKLNKPWMLIGKILDPLEQKYDWVKGELSPGPIFAPEFIKYKGLFVGLFNARSPAKKEGDVIHHGEYAAGIMLVDPVTGKIPWISPDPFIKDPDARNITFVSDFVQTGKDRGIVYAHIDDSFIRAYILSKEALEHYLEKVKI